MSVIYDEYLKEHRANVLKAFNWIVEHVPSVFEDDAGRYDMQLQKDVEYQITYGHDASKNDKEEYDAYDRYFYGNNRSYKVVNDFNLAWLHHIHNNPHHWQYWILLNDDPNPLEKEMYIDIPDQYIIEMICDWWSFGWRDKNPYELFEWYYQHKDNIRMSQGSRFRVEEILDLIKEELDKD